MRYRFFIGVLIGVASAVNDFYYALSGIEPDFWLQGFGILIFNICMFEMLSIRAIRADRLLKSSTEKIKENAELMAAFLGRVEKISLSVAEMSTTLDSEIESSTANVGELVSGTDIISSASREQLDYVNENGGRALRFFSTHPTASTRSLRNSSSMSPRRRTSCPRCLRTSP